MASVGRQFNPDRIAGLHLGSDVVPLPRDLTLVGQEPGVNKHFLDRSRDRVSLGSSNGAADPTTTPTGSRTGKAPGLAATYAVTAW